HHATGSVHHDDTRRDERSSGRIADDHPELRGWQSRLFPGRGPRQRAGGRERSDECGGDETTQAVFFRYGLEKVFDLNRGLTVYRSIVHSSVGVPSTLCVRRWGSFTPSTDR